MATSGGEDSAFRKTFFCCPLCMDMYDNPKTLPCLHTFCLKCLQKYTEGRRTDLALPCPLCNVVASVPGRKIDNFPSNFTLKEMMKFSGVHARKSDFFCRTCDAWLNRETVSAHQEELEFVEHELVANQNINDRCKLQAEEKLQLLGELDRLMGEEVRFCEQERHSVLKQSEETKEKIKSRAEEVGRMVAEQARRLTDEVDSFYTLAEKKINLNLSKAASVKSSIKTATKTLEKIGESGDGESSESLLQSVEEVVAEAQCLPLQSQNKASRSVKDFTYTDNQLGGFNIGVLTECKLCVVFYLTCKLNFCL